MRMRDAVQDKSGGSDRTYTVRARCANCLWEGALVIAYGDAAPRGILGSRADFVCERCGCATLRRVGE